MYIASTSNDGYLYQQHNANNATAFQIAKLPLSNNAHMILLGLDKSAVRVHGGVQGLWEHLEQIQKARSSKVSRKFFSFECVVA